MLNKRTSFSEDRVHIQLRLKHLGEPGELGRLCANVTDCYLVTELLSAFTAN